MSTVEQSNWTATSELQQFSNNGTSDILREEIILTPRSLTENGPTKMVVRINGEGPTRIVVDYLDGTTQYQAVWDSIMCKSAEPLAPEYYMVLSEEHMKVHLDEESQDQDKKWGKENRLKKARSRFKACFGIEDVSIQSVETDPYHLINIHEDHLGKFLQFIERALEFLPQKKIESIYLGDLFDLSHYLGNECTNNRSKDLRVLCAEVKAAQPDFVGADDEIKEHRIREAEIFAIEEVLGGHKMWLSIHSYKRADDLEMATCLRRIDELRILLKERYDVTRY